MNRDGKKETTESENARTGVYVFGMRRKLRDRGNAEIGKNRMGRNAK